MTMNYFTIDRLFSSLKDVSNYAVLEKSQNSKVVISEYGGRPIGIFPDPDSISLLWINPNLPETIKNRQRDIGGDRYWISPERLFFYKNPVTWEGWFCPEKLDPATYKILDQTTTTCELETLTEVKNQMSDEIYKGKITRRIELIDDPLDSGLDYCGIQHHDICQLDQPNLKVNGWSLTNVVSGGPSNPGTVLIPTKPNPKSLSYFRTIPENRLIKGDDYIGFKIDVDEIYKLAVRPEDIDFSRKAKIGYVLKIPNSEEYSFLVKLSDDIPQSQDECFDVARDHPDSEIGVIQSYNSESPNKPQFRYGEIEFQLNLFETKGEKSIGEARHQLLAYTGSKDRILKVVKEHLGILNPELF